MHKSNDNQCINTQNHCVKIKKPGQKRPAKQRIDRFFLPHPKKSGNQPPQKTAAYSLTVCKKISLLLLTKQRICGIIRICFWRRSSAGQSVRFTSERSWVRAPPSPPYAKVACVKTGDFFCAQAGRELYKTPIRHAHSVCLWQPPLPRERLFCLPLWGAGAK